MSNTLSIRPELPEDAAAIADVIERAFATLGHDGRVEQCIVNALREAGALALSLVGIRMQVVVGHIAFSRVAISDGTGGWYGLGPLSVEPQLQRQGIGTALVQSGLTQLRALGAAGCVVLGDPAYYGRFGFRSSDALTYAGARPRYFMALPFDGGIPRGEVTYHAAFPTAG